MRRVSAEQFTNIAGIRQSSLSRNDLDTGYTNSRTPTNRNPGTTYPTQPTVDGTGVFKGTVIEWDRQTDLTNFSHYEVRVSPTAGAPWYLISFGGTGLGTETTTTLPGTVWPNEFLVHAPLPLAGTAEEPLDSSWTYSVRRVTRTGRASAWSTFVTVAASAIDDGSLAKDSIYGNNIRAGAISTDKLTVGLQGDIQTGLDAGTVASNAQDVADAAADVADAAADAAAAAQQDATEALSDLADIANDSRLTPNEKHAVQKEWDTIVDEKPRISTQATAYAVDDTAYTAAYNALSTYISPLLADMTTTDVIVGTTFRANFAAYYSEKIQLLNAISAVIEQAAEDAQTAADNASAAAGLAQDAADAAQIDATDALADLSDIASDAKLTPSEKHATQKEWDQIEAERSGIVVQATTYSVSSTTYQAAYDALDDYLNDVTTGLLNDTTTTSDITGATFRQTFEDYYTARTNLLQAIADEILQDAQDYATSEAETIAESMGYANYQALKDAASSSPATTIIDNGYIRTVLLETAALATLFANVSYELTIGFGGTGSDASPDEGDRRIRVVGDEIKLEVYTNESWSSERRIAIGGTDTHGNFLPFFQGRGLIGDVDDAPVDDPVPPDDSLRLFKFDLDMEDQDGNNPWTINYGTASYNSGVKWEGTHSLYPNVMGTDGLFWAEYANGWTTGNSCSASFRLYVGDSDNGNTGLIGFGASNLDDSISTVLGYSSFRRIIATIDKGGTETVLRSAEVEADTWYLVAIVYDADADLLSLWLDDDLVTVTPSGTWGTPTARTFDLILANDPMSTPGRRRYMDDLLVSPTYAISNDKILQHVQRDRPWTTDYTSDDIILVPGPNGKVKVRDADGSYRDL